MQESPHTTVYAVGLTGGIGSGKTAAGNLFRDLGADIIDADEISRSLTGTGSPLGAEILRYFGEDVADASGGLDRAKLRDRVFHDPGARAWLEALLHPAIRAEIRRRLDRSDAPYAIVVVPLLVESGSYDFLDRILVVDAPEPVQEARVRRRDGSPPDLIRQIIASQASRQQRLDKADDVIDNSGSIDALETRVRQLHKQYLEYAAGRN